MTRKRTIACVSLAVFAVGVAFLLSSPLSLVEDQVTTLKYQLRGRQPADTNIVIVYVDNDAVRDVGRPVRRNFYALIVKVLTDVGVKAIGIEPVFEEPNPEYAEYDDLLATTIANSGRVVLSSYFSSLPAAPESAASRQTDPLFTFPAVLDVIPSGRDLHRPFTRVETGAAGVGHVNLMNNTDIPVLVRSAEGVVPAFGMEVLRVFLGVARQDVVSREGEVLLGSHARVHVGKEETVSLNFPGPINAFRAYPFLEVLRSYDAMRLGRSQSVPLQSLKDKIVLIGVVAEDHSVSVNTPVAARFPSIGLHATFLDNALRSRFMGQPGNAAFYLYGLVLGLLCAGASLFLKSPFDKVAPAGLLVLVCLVSILLFEKEAYLLPVTPLLFVGLVSMVGAFLYQHRLESRDMQRLRAERDAVVAELSGKEARVREMEGELLQIEASRSADRTAELMEEIRRYKAEIHALSSRADDMEESPEGEEPAGTFEGIIYDPSGPMKPVIEFIGKIAGSDAPVLILGESGTGKELVARAIHHRSTRGERPFVAVNCGALSETLLESELFGHERGAFTGAVKDRLGRFELADGGTIFLDEIGDVSEAFQLKLLRVVQEGELQRVGGTANIKVNVRVVAATNKDLKEQVRLRRFREDLFYRLNVLTVSVPPLRERENDIPLLIGHFLRREDVGIKVSKNVMNALQAYAWRGNVRELESVIRRCVLLAKADGRTMVTLKDLTEEVVAATREKTALEDQILESLREKGFSRSSVSDTADELGGLNRGTVAEHLRGICLKAFVENGFKIEPATDHVSLSRSPEVNDRVRKKILEYLSNITEVADPSLSWDEVRKVLRPKTKNLPQRFHPYVEQVAAAYHKGELPPLDSPS